MADAKVGDAKGGPVKPPVLDLKARPSDAKPDIGPVKPASAAVEKTPSSAGEPAQKPFETKPSDPKPAEPKPLASGVTDAKPGDAKPFESRPSNAGKPATSQPKAGGGFPVVATLAGGVLGLVAAYGLAAAGLWPSATAPTPAADPRLAQFASAIPELRTVTETTQSELATLNQRMSSLEAGAGATVPAASEGSTGLDTIETELAALAGRVDALAAAPAATPGPADTAGLEALRSDLASLGGRVDELGARLGTTEASVATLDTSVAQTSAALAEQPSDIGAVLQLPLVLSGLEAAFTSGRPYETELAALRMAVPDAAVPPAIANSATTGLARPDTIAAGFAAVLPAILGGRPANPEAGWQDGAMDWFRSAIALRPTGELAGDDPEAVVSRLDGAIARRDFVSAQSLFAALPAPMVAAAGEIPGMVDGQAEAAKFLDTLRTAALAGNTGATP